MSADTFLISLCSLAAAYCFLLLPTASRRLRFETTTPGKHSHFVLSRVHSAHHAFNFAIRERERETESLSRRVHITSWKIHARQSENEIHTRTHAVATLFALGLFPLRRTVYCTHIKRPLAASRVSNFPVEISKSCFFRLNEVGHCSRVEIAGANFLCGHNVSSG